MFNPVFYLTTQNNSNTNMSLNVEKINAKHIKYIYNGDGQRVGEFVDGSFKGYFYNGNQVVAEYDDTGKVTAQYIHGKGLGADVGSLICKDELDESETDGVNTSYFFYNHRGDVVGIADEDGAIKASYRYDSFGNIIEKNETGIENSLLFSSKKFNEAIGLSYFGARYYDAFIGRFISRDPMGYIDGPNQYFYVANNPLGYIDPFGLSLRMTTENVTQKTPLIKDSTKFKQGSILVGASLAKSLAMHGLIGAVSLKTGPAAPVTFVVIEAFCTTVNIGDAIMFAFGTHLIIESFKTEIPEPSIANENEVKNDYNIKPEDSLN